jgi:hypothetical protein
MTLTVNTSGHLYHDFLVLIFFHSHCEFVRLSALTIQLPEESDQFRFLRPSVLDHLKESVGLILTKDSVMRVSSLSTLTRIYSLCPLPRRHMMCFHL